MINVFEDNSNVGIFYLSDEERGKIISEIKSYIHKGFDPKILIAQCEHKIIALNDSKLSYFFAKNVKGAHVDLHLNIAIADKDYDILFKFAQNIPGVNVDAIGEILVNSFNTKLLELFVEKCHPTKSYEYYKDKIHKLYYKEYDKLQDLQLNELSAAQRQEIKLYKINDSIKRTNFLKYIK